MTIQIKPELEDLIRRDVERGSYRSIDEYLERAVQILHEEEEILAQEEGVRRCCNRRWSR